MPHVSVIVPTHNRAEYVVEAIQSVQAQDFADYELLVADDGSTDETPARVAAFGSRLRYLRLDHSGRPSVTRNRALAQARGALVAFLDDDDLWLPDKLARQVAMLDNDPALGWVYSDVRFLYPDGTHSPSVMKPHQKQSGIIFDHLLGDCFVHPSTVVIRRPLLDQVGWFDETLTSAEDYDLWVRLAHAMPVGFVAEPLTLVRRHATEISRLRERASHEAVLGTLERTGKRYALSAKQRARLRRARAEAHTRLGRLLAQEGSTIDARGHFLHALWLRPLQRYAWTALADSYRPKRPA